MQSLSLSIQPNNIPILHLSQPNVTAVRRLSTGSADATLWLEYAMAKPIISSTVGWTTAAVMTALNIHLYSVQRTHCIRMRSGSLFSRTWIVICDCNATNSNSNSFRWVIVVTVVWIHFFFLYLGPPHKTLGISFKSNSNQSERNENK